MTFASPVSSVGITIVGTVLAAYFTRKMAWHTAAGISLAAGFLVEALTHDVRVRAAIDDAMGAIPRDIQA